ncbi:MAG: cytochrome c [Terracidiphilus sp.]|jgi:mono/diheme cytochrome c family protein
MGRFLLGFLLAIVLVPVCLVGWLRFGRPPVAVSDPPLPQERLLAGMALNTRVHREMNATPPIQDSEDNLVAGARIYSEKCAVCHGFHGKPSALGAQMYPDAPPLWEMHHHGTETMMGVSDDPPGETYWKVANGIRLTGMPAFKGVLSETEMWQVSLLLARADKLLPPGALDILRGEPAAQPASPPLPEKITGKTQSPPAKAAPGSGNRSNQ